MSFIEISANNFTNNHIYIFRNTRIEAYEFKNHVNISFIKIRNSRNLFKIYIKHYFSVQKNLIKFRFSA